MKSLHVAAAVLLGSALCPTFAQQFGSTPRQTKARPDVALKLASTKPGPSTSSSLLPPANDACASAQVVVGGGPFAWTNVGATTDGGAESCGTPNQDVWFTWNATGTGLATVSLCTPAANDTVIAIYNGVGCPIAGTAIECDDDSCFTGFDESVGQFNATSGQNYTIRIGGFGGFTGSGSFTVSVSGPPVNDDCSSPSAIAGTGSFPFDNTAASTGTQGQNEGNCLFFSDTTIDNDIWFSWTAPSTDTFQVNTCGDTSVDTKIAIYNGPGCPADGSSIACNDDACPGFQSTLSFNGTAGNVYTIQLGTFPGASGGTGTFDISTVLPPGPCDVYHDGSTEQGIGLTNGGEIAWLHREGAAAGSTTVSSISTAWGDPIFGSGIPNGTPAKIAIWDDPNDDGNPTDCVLLQLVNTVVANVDTNTLNTTPITPQVVNGFYFIGAGLAQPANTFPAPEDTHTASNGRAWAVGSTAGPLNYNNLGANNVPPLDVDTAGLPGVWLLECACSAGNPIEVVCVPGSGGVLACPCTPGIAGNGCASSGNPSGGNLAGSGNPSLASDGLILTGTMQSSSLSVLWQSTLISNGQVLGDGVSCLDGVLHRLFTGPVTGGNKTYGPGTISAASAAKGDTITAGTSRLYQVFSRDPNTTFCNPAPATFNITNGVKVTWSN
jgi:hypothetical protein